MTAVSERVLLPSDLVPKHYGLEITPDFTNFTFACVEKITVTVVNAVKTFSLHAREISVHSMTFQGQSPVEIHYNVKYHTVEFLFEKEFEVGDNFEVLINYTGILNNDMAGFYRSSYTDADGIKKIMGSTQFEPLDARRAFLCWDEPARKATFTVILIVDKHLTALSNMPETEVVNMPGNKKKVTFGVSPLMSTYLLAWAIGEFDFVSGTTKGGVTIRVFTQPNRAAQGKFALDVGIKSLDFYDNFFQVPYPLPKLDMISIPEFAMGAMENWGLVTYRENALMIDESKASSQMKQRVATVVTHELAHQWFGNLVTMQWWDGLWLNEGFASFMEDFCVDDIFPEYKIWEQWTIDSYGAAQRLDSLRSSHPIIVPIRHAHEVEQVFDAISYSKGSTIVNMVFHLLGKEHFQAGLVLYFKKYAYQNTETIDLWNAWSEASGLKVDEIMDLWTSRYGYPYLSIISEKWSETQVELTLRQTWFLADGSLTTDENSAANAPVWNIPLFFATADNVSSKAVMMNKLEQSFTIPLTKGASDYLKINAGQRALCRVNPSVEQLARLTKNLPSLTPVDLASLVLDSYALAKAGVSSLDNVIQIIKHMPMTTSYVVWAAMAGIFSALELHIHEIGGAAYDAYVDFVKAKVVAALKVVGWDAKANDGHTDKLLRATLIGLLDTFAYNDPEVLAEAQSRFDGHFDNPSLLPSEYKTTVYKIVLMNGGEQVYDKILKTFYATGDNQEKRYALLSLGVTPHTALKIKTMDWATKSGDVKLQDFFYAYGPVAQGKGSVGLAWTYYQENFDYIKAKLANASPSLMDAVIVNCCNRFISYERANELEQFFTAHPLPSSARRISQQLELIRSNAKLLDIVKTSSIASNTSIWN
jgi:puromycin-sensitive aminopeptidase